MLWWDTERYGYALKQPDVQRVLGVIWVQIRRYKYLRKKYNISFDACKTIPTSSQKRYVKPKRWNKKEIDLMLKIRRENTKYLFTLYRLQFRSTMAELNEKIKSFERSFYAASNLLEDTLNSMRIKLQQAVKKYNEYRPHSPLHGLTPYMLYQPLLRRYFVSEYVK